MRVSANGQRLTDQRPQVSSFAWTEGVTLVNYTSDKGDKLQAALFLPAGYEKGKAYPTIVNIYEKMSQGANQFANPTANGFNRSYYTSNGYAVLLPDITYKVNDPGMSAVWCVVPALKAAIATGIVDAKKVGLTGHSWGGYQTSFLVTQTDMFAAAVAGAPLTNMISMYSLIYKNTGGGNGAIFEASQGRFKGGYWDNWDAYYRNSPVFFAKNVKTPLMILHNDKDGAVDFTQGVEYYNTLRRLQKPVIMLEYIGENHGLRKPSNMRDYTVRMKEYFDHYLKGAPAPEWLTKGVPRLQMEEHLKERAKPAAPAKPTTTTDKRKVEIGWLSATALIAARKTYQCATVRLGIREALLPASHARKPPARLSRQQPAAEPTLVSAAPAPAAAGGSWRFGLDLAAVDEDVDDARVVLEEIAARSR